jgi:hypothetical protein
MVRLDGKAQSMIFLKPIFVNRGIALQKQAAIALTRKWVQRNSHWIAKMSECLGKAVYACFRLPNSFLRMQGAIPPQLSNTILNKKSSSATVDETMK